MRRSGFRFRVLFVSGCWLLASGGAPSFAKEVRLNAHTFTLPDGFEVEQIAGPPLVNRPITADFDELGRLYVADSSGSNDKVDKQLAERPHRIVRLEDRDGDGRFDHSTVFADKMMFPEGTMWFDGSLYVSAPPSIWKLTDTNNDGVADVRVEWFQGKTLTGCANDLHGPYLGPDGWIYWCKGAFAQQTYERPGKAPLVTRAAHIFRCRPDGTGIEPVMTGGMDNPVDVVFSPGGERFFTTTFLQHPGGGLRDGIIHAIYGGVYGKVHAVLDGHPRTSPDVMPVLTHLGPAAPCGLARYESEAFGADYRDNLFATLFNLQKVTRHKLTAHGATFTSQDSDFLVSDNKDFHPTDVQEDADGSLVVVDTGGWYKLCCPTSQLWKPDVLGAIYRVKRTAAPHIDDPRGLELPWPSMNAAEAVRLLGDSRPAVRRRAIHTLARKGAAAAGLLDVAVQESTSVEARRGAVWAATQIGDPSARGVVRRALSDADETVRQAAIHSVSVWRDRDAVPMLLSVLGGPSAQNRRAAAEALGRIGDPQAVAGLLGQLARPAEHILEHSLTFALIEINDPSRTLDGLSNPNVKVRRAALIALDQMPGGRLNPQQVAPFLTCPEGELRETASWIIGRHPDWGDDLAGFLRNRLRDASLAAGERAEFEQQLGRFAGSATVQEIMAGCLGSASSPRASRLTVLRAMALAGLKQVPATWVAGLIRVLEGSDLELARQAAATVRGLTLAKAESSELGAALLNLAQHSDLPDAVRLEALAGIPGGAPRVSAELYALLRAHLKPDQPVASRAVAAEVLARARLTIDQLRSLTGAIRTAGPLELDRLLGAYEQATDESLGLDLIAALRQSPSLTSLRADAVKSRLAKYSPKVQQQADELSALLNADLARQKARLEELVSSLSSGDIRRGQAVFNSQKAACSTCHAIGYLGGHVGPDLTRIGQIRTERDLLESILFPSASFVRSYEPVTVATKDGRVVNGLVKKDSADELVLVTSATEEARIPRDDIEEMRPGTVSVMPAGLDQQLATQELTDLVAFLKACK